MTNAKVKLPREVAEAIEYLRTITQSNHELIRVVEFEMTNPIAVIVRKWAFETKSPDWLMQALVSGYEIEKTPEEKVLQYYEGIREKAFRSDMQLYSAGYNTYWRQADVVKETLDLLDIKIEGVNA